jgi:uncharacterized protein (TIGR02266 family)
MSGGEEHDGEKRAHDRTPIRLIVDYEDADDFLGDYTVNLSAGGTFIHTTRLLETGTEIALVLSFPGLLHPIELTGVVRWSRGGPQPGAGIEFLPGGDRDRLDALVRLIQSRDPRAVARVLRILVAEDNPHITELLCSGLGASAKRTFGDELAFCFATAENGASALQLLREVAFDLAIIDVYLPVLDGTKVIDQVRSELGLRLPIIAISEGGEPARNSAIRAGADVFLAKPMRLREVFDSMRQLVPLSA